MNKIVLAAALLFFCLSAPPYVAADKNTEKNSVIVGVAGTAEAVSDNIAVDSKIKEVAVAQKETAVSVVETSPAETKVVVKVEETPEEEYDEEEYGPEAPIVWTKPVMGVLFSHKIHTMEAGLECDSCHDDLFEMEAGLASEQEDFVMKTIYAGGYCGACHDGDNAFAANTQCAACHIGVRGMERLGLTEDESGHETE